MASLSEMFKSPMQEAQLRAEEAAKAKELSDLAFLACMLYCAEGGDFASCVKRALDLRITCQEVFEEASLALE